MVKAIPIDIKGNVCGEPKTFSDTQFSKMKRTFGKNFAWRQIDIISQETTLKPVAVSTKIAVSRTIKETEIIKEDTAEDIVEEIPLSVKPDKYWKTKKNKKND